MKEKIFTIVEHTRNGDIREEQGTIKEFCQWYGTTLSYWHKATPKTIQGLINALNQCVDIRYACCYRRPYYEIKK